MQASGEILIRKAEKKDIEQVWQLMHDLAVFEQYIDSFAITPESIEKNCFDSDPPVFYCLVAEDEASNKVAGMLVYYFYPYTAQNRPALYMKELYVHPDFRGRQIGERLMKAVAKEAKAANCCQIKWGVAPWNADGIRFYERLGAKENRDWLHFELNEKDFLTLADE